MKHPITERPPEGRNRTRSAKSSRWTFVGLSAAAGALLVATAALGEDDRAVVSAQPAGGAQICSPDEACTLINGLADDTDRKSVLTTYAAALELAQPADACPQVTESYSEGGIVIDGVLGPCPPRVNTIEASQAATHAAAAGFELGGSR